MVPRPNSYPSDESTDARRICRDNPDPIPQQALVPFRVVVDAPPTTPVLPLHSVILLDTGYEVLHHIYEYRRYVRQTVPDIILIGFVRAPFGAFGWRSSRRLLRRRSMPTVLYTHLYQVWSISLIVVRDRRPNWGAEVTCVSGVVICRASNRWSRYSFWLDSGSTSVNYVIVWD